MGYQELLEERGLKIIAWEIFGSYQGDYGVVVKSEDKLGFVVIGYGSCSGCDAYEALETYNSESGKYEIPKDEANALANDIINSIFWGTADEVRAKINNEFGDNNWYRHDSDFDACKEKLVAATYESSSLPEISDPETPLRDGTVKE